MKTRFLREMRPALVFIAISLGACQTITPAPEIEVSDQLVWSSAPAIRAKNLTPGANYTLELERTSLWGIAASERSSTSYTADGAGRIDTTHQPAKIDPALRPYLPIRSLTYEDVPSDVAKGQLRLRLRDNTDAIIAERETRIDPDGATLNESPLGDAFPGAFVLRPKQAAKPLPAIVMLGGSEGGDGGARAQAPTYAAEGYAVLGLPYYSPAWFGRDAQIPALPRAFDELPIDYLEAAVTELRRRPDIDADRIMLLGGSKGAEYVLLAGSLINDSSPGGGFCAIVADVPSDVVWEGWGRGDTETRYSGFSWRGEPLPFVPYVDMGKALNARRTGDTYTMTEAHENGRVAYADRVDAARIRVENINEPVLVIGGGQDEVWASAKMAQTIKETRDAAGLTTAAFIHPDAGHGVGGDPLQANGSANLKARLTNFPATIAFLKQNARRSDCRN